MTIPSPAAPSFRSHGPRERLAALGPLALSDTELVALLLSTGSRDQPAPVLAERLLALHGGLSGLSRCGIGQLARSPGVGTSKAARLLAGVELGRRLSAQPLTIGLRIGSSLDVYRSFAAWLPDERQECFWALALDSRHRLIGRTLVARGSIRMCPVSPCDAFRPLVREAATGAIFVHNHPSGAPDPSTEDAELTDRLIEAGRLLGIRVLDHVIVGTEGYFSFLDAGLLAP
jgi:DNA repair protein RadC